MCHAISRETGLVSGAASLSRRAADPKSHGQPQGVREGSTPLPRGCIRPSFPKTRHLRRGFAMCHIFLVPPPLPCLSFLCRACLSSHKAKRSTPPPAPLCTSSLNFHGGMKCSTDVLKYSTEVSNIPRRGLNVFWRCQIFHGGGQVFHAGMKCSTEVRQYSTDCQIFHGGGQIFHGGMKCSMEGRKRSMEVSNIPRRGLNIPRRYDIFPGGAQMFHGGVKYSTEVLRYSREVSNIPRRGLNVPRRCQIFHGGG